MLYIRFTINIKLANFQVWLMILVTSLTMLLAMYAIVTTGYRYRLVESVQTTGNAVSYWYCNRLLTILYGGFCYTVHG